MIPKLGINSVDFKKHSDLSMTRYWSSHKYGKTAGTQLFTSALSGLMKPTLGNH